MASRMEWYLLVQEEAAWLRLENKVGNIAKIVTRTHLTSLAPL